MSAIDILDGVDQIKSGVAGAIREASSTVRSGASAIRVAALETMASGESEIDALQMFNWVKDCSDARSGLDIYLLTSVVPSRLNVFKACVTAFIQIVIVPLVISEALQQSSKITSNFCEQSPWKQHFYSKITAAAFAVYLNFDFYRFRAKMFNVNNTPMRFFHEKKRAVFTNTWMFAGICINAVALFTVSVAGIILMYNCTASFDVVLRALTIGFLAGLDNRIVSGGDYSTVEKFLTAMPPGERSQMVDIHAQSCWLKLHSFLVLPPMVVTAVFLFLAPFWLLVCW